MLRRAWAPLMLVAVGALLAACVPHAYTPQTLVPGGDPVRGAAVIAEVGCGGCHMIPGIVGANGAVGPPLTGIGVRTIIAGKLPNTPDNLVRWIETPQSVDPGDAMPNMEINDHDARDVAAYLYTLR